VDNRGNCVLIDLATARGASMILMSVLGASASDREWEGRIAEIGGQDLSFNELAAIIYELAPEEVGRPSALDRHR